MSASVRWSEPRDLAPPRTEHAPARDDVPTVEDIDQLQRSSFQLAGWPESPHPDGVLRWVAANHRYNSLLWDEEDQARRTDVPDSEIAANKRAIDRYNQLRNDAIESIDDTLLEAMPDHQPREDAWVNSETAGSIVDRLSINALKLHHMQLQLERTGVSQAHRLACSSKLERLRIQRQDLLQCLERLLHGMADGSCTFRVYRQFKMYNDPALNPYLCGMKDGRSAGAALNS